MLLALLPYIERLYSLEEVLKESQVVAVGTIERTDAERKICIVRIDESLQGKCDYPQLRINVGVGQDWHPAALLQQLQVGSKVVWFYRREEAGLPALVYVNRYFFQVFGEAGKPPERTWWNFTHFEIHMNRTYRGTVAELAALVRRHAAGQGGLPAPDASVAPLTRERIAAAGDLRTIAAGLQQAVLSQQAPAPAAAPAVGSVDGDEPRATGRDSVVLLKWDLSSIPAGTRVVAAAIELTVTDPSEDAYPIRAVVARWQEGQAGWLARRQGQAWERPGADGPADASPEPVGLLRAAAVGRVEVALNERGVALVQQWIDRPETNFGVRVGAADLHDGLDFALGGAADAAQRPTLTVRLAGK